MRWTWVITLLVGASAWALDSETREPADPAATLAYDEGGFVPVDDEVWAELESIKLDAWGERKDWWLGRWSDVSSSTSWDGQVSKRRMGPFPDELATYMELRSGLEAYEARPIETSLALWGSWKDWTNQANVMARPAVAVRFFSRAEVSSAVTLMGAGGATTLSYPETAASLTALTERGARPSMLFRAAVISPVTVGGESVTAFGARSSKRLGVATLNTSADYINESATSKRYSVGISAAAPVTEKLFLRGNAFYQRQLAFDDRLVTGEGGLSYKVTRHLQMDGSLRVQHGPQFVPPYMFFGLVVL